MTALIFVESVARSVTGSESHTALIKLMSCYPVIARVERQDRLISINQLQLLVSAGSLVGITSGEITLHFCLVSVGFSASLRFLLNFVQ